MMIGRRWGLLLALGVLGSRSLAAQVVQLATPSDTAVSIVVGDSARVRLEVFAATGGVSAYSVTLLFDGSRVTVTGADSVPGYGLAKPTITTLGTDSVTIAVASGGTYTFTTVELADIRFKLNAAATQGSLVSLRVNSLTNVAGTDLRPSSRTSLLNICQANTYWGDLTGEHIVNSRDALVALTYAVGLPVGSFDVSPGDVDADSAVTSRDALMILSYSIGISTGSYRLGTPKRNLCAPLQAMPNDLVFYRSADIYRVAAGDTIPIRVPLALPPYTAGRPVWSPDGTKILYTAYTSPYYYEVVSSTSPFTTVDTLTRNSAFDGLADWSPDGTRIAFVSTRVAPASVFLMNADGSNQQQVSFNLNVSTTEPISWSPDGKHLAVIGYCNSCSPTIWVVQVDSATTTPVLSAALSFNPQAPLWNRTGDSVLFYNNHSNSVYIKSVVPSDTGHAVMGLNGGGDSPAVALSGPALRSYLRYPYDFILQRATDGRYFRLLRSNGSDNAYSFRRLP